jgi:dihydroorotase
MNKKEKLTLIEGVFSGADAAEILLNIFRAKLQFHKMKNFSSQERFGKEDLLAQKRIPELNKSIDMINKFIEDNKHNNTKFRIHSEIIIESVKNA